MRGKNMSIPPAAFKLVKTVSNAAMDENNLGLKKKLHHSQCVRKYSFFKAAIVIDASNKQSNGMQVWYFGLFAWRAFKFTSFSDENDLKWLKKRKRKENNPSRVNQCRTDLKLDFPISRIFQIKDTGVKALISVDDPRFYHFCFIKKVKHALEWSKPEAFNCLQTVLNTTEKLLIGTSWTHNCVLSWYTSPF